MAKSTAVKDTKPATKLYTSVDTFIDSASLTYNMLDIQKAGFKAYMKSRGLAYLPEITDFMPYLKKYLGTK